MFLALKEMLHSKRKFILIIFVVVLIAYLVYFLTSLAYGLASSYTNGLEKIEANTIILDKNANDNLMMSMLDDKDFDQVSSGKKEKLGLFPAVILKKDAANRDETKEEVYLFGVENIQFFLPKDDHEPLQGNQIIIDDSVKSLGYEIGDEIMMPGYQSSFLIVGFTTKATYQTAPIVYMSLEAFRIHRFGENINTDIFNAVVVKGAYEIEGDELLAYTIADYIKTLPGYMAQVLTFSMMIIFLIVIVAFVLGIFIYVLTIQKVSIFGVMKAQGISSVYISLSVLSQTVLMVLIGVLIGFGLTQLTGYFLSGIVPFAANYLFYAVITLAFFLFAIVGGLFSVSTVVKIDPLKAIG